MAVSLTNARFEVMFRTQLANTIGTASAQNTVTDLFVSGTTALPALKKTLTDGATANKADNVWHDRRTITAGANSDLDLNNGSLFNAHGVALALTRVVWFLMRLTAPATGVRLVVGNAAADPWLAWFGAVAHTEEVRGILLKENQIDAWTVSGTSKVLRINNPTGSSITYDIAVVGSP